MVRRRGGGYRVIPVRTERLAPSQAADCQPSATCGTVYFECLDCVTTAGREVATCGGPIRAHRANDLDKPAEQSGRWRHQLVASDDGTGSDMLASSRGRRESCARFVRGGDIAFLLESADFVSSRARSVASSMLSSLYVQSRARGCAPNR